MRHSIAQNALIVNFADGILQEKSKLADEYD